MQNSNYLTVDKFSSLYPTFTMGALRALIFNADKNGFDKVFIRFSPTGRRGRILINVSKFFEWLEEQGA